MIKAENNYAVIRTLLLLFYYFNNPFNDTYVYPNCYSNNFIFFSVYFAFEKKERAGGIIFPLQFLLFKKINNLKIITLLSRNEVLF